MATINLSWTRNSGGGTPTKYAIYRRIGDFAEGSVKNSPDAGFPIIVSNVASDDPAAETFTDTTNGNTTAVNSLILTSDPLTGSGTRIPLQHFLQQVLNLVTQLTQLLLKTFWRKPSMMQRIVAK